MTYLEAVEKAVITKKLIIAKNLIIEKGYKDTRLIELDEIHVPKHDANNGNNPTRYNLNGKNIDELQLSLMKPNWSLPLMVVKIIPGGRMINGKTYYYELVAGFHRFEALIRNLTPKWWFTVYNFTGNPEAESDLQALENDHTPRLSMNVEGLTNWLVYQVEQTEAAMNKKVDILKYTSSKTKTAAVNNAVNTTGAYKDVTVRSIKEIKEFLEEDDNYLKNGETNRAPYTHSGELDPTRLEHGWTVKERYEDEFVFNAIKKFKKTGKTSYFVGHVNVPKKGTVNEARAGMLKNFKKHEDALEATMKYKERTGNWPWRVESFFKQDNHPDTREKFWVDVESVLPKKGKLPI